jgi:hypothetical protein
MRSDLLLSLATAALLSSSAVAGPIDFVRRAASVSL